MSKKIIWMIDENQLQLNAFKRELSFCLDNALDVEAILPYPTMQEYLEPVINNDRTVVIIIDQRLTDEGTVNYTGIDLAEYLRAINPKLPIYILTNFPDDEEFSGRELNVEYILDKSEFINEADLKMIAARILRHIDTYKDILTERGKRFNNLLRKSLKEELNTDEFCELEQLNYLRLSTTLASELEQIRDLTDIISENRRLLSLFGKESGDGQ